MQSTISRPITPSALKCEFCGAELVQREISLCGKTIFAGFVQCNCTQAQKERQKQAETELRERFYRALELAEIPERFFTASHPLASKLATDVGSGSSLYIHGGFGVGKTHLACAVLRRLVWQGEKGVRFTSDIEIIRALQATFGAKESEEEVLGEFVGCNVLIIDDLGKEAPSEYVLTRLFKVIDGRYAKKRRTVITTNYKIADLAKRLSKNSDGNTAEAIMSRICEVSKFVELSGADRRLV